MEATKFFIKVVGQEGLEVLFEVSGVESDTKEVR